MTFSGRLERGIVSTGNICTFTKNGDARIKGCRKFDLGAGYGLVSVKQGNDLYLLFVRTHDECSRWIENNRQRLPLEIITGRCRTTARMRHGEPADPEAPPTRETDAGDDWMPPLSDQDLRIIFSGLVGGS
ncbi:MAG TPA: hypothetical protein VLT88_03555 [Desulfosarcina sp.]|nr:hypothetical protein [Desulfosarcina sp.]